MTRRTSRKRTSLRRRNSRLRKNSVTYRAWISGETGNAEELYASNAGEALLIAERNAASWWPARVGEYVHLVVQRGAGRGRNRVERTIRVGVRENSRRRTSLRRNSRRRTSLRPNANARYSGDTTVSVRYDDNKNAYYTTVKSPDGSRRIVVGRAPADRTAVDSPAAYDSAAHAAISFAMDEGLDCQPDYNEAGSGYTISRSKKLRKNSRRRQGPPPQTYQYRRPMHGLNFVALDPSKRGMNREGLTWDEWRYAAGTGGLTTAKLLAAWQDGEDPTEYRALRSNPRPSNSRSKSPLRRNSRKEKPAGKIENDTVILPWAVADGVLEELQVATDFTLPLETARALAGELSERAQIVYEHNEVFRKKIRGGGNRGRDHLYAFMRHWLAAAVKKQHPAVFRKLPPGWGWDA